MREGEAVLARNVAGDSAIGARDSQGEILATSVICARSATADRCSGWYTSTRPTPAGRPNPDDLEFTLAVADTVAVALENIRHRQELAENLSQVRTEIVQLRERLGTKARSSATAR